VLISLVKLLERKHCSVVVVELLTVCFSGMLVRNGGSFEDDLSLGAEGGCGRIMTLFLEKRKKKCSVV